jgi:hypothetical protein
MDLGNKGLCISKLNVYIYLFAGFNKHSNYSFIIKSNNMKFVKMSTGLLMSACLVLFNSCNSGGDKKPAADSTPPVVAAVPAAPKDVMIVKHKVANYAKWKTGYDSGDSIRMANGLHNYVIGRGIEDSNTVIVAMWVNDVEKAKTFASSPMLKDAMKQHGVISTPEIDYLHRVSADTTTLPSMDRVMLKHKVKDFDAWKKVYDEDKKNRMDAGLTDRSVSTTVGDNHMVSLVFAFSDMAKLKAFMSSKELAEKMKAGGVEGPPTSFAYHVVQLIKP